MTEPDEAILWARERAAKWQDEGGGKAGPSYRSGKLDGLLGEEVEGYRAGQAASTERIKALEEALREVIEDYDWVQGGPGDRDWNVLDNTIIRARAVLKEADQ